MSTDSRIELMNVSEAKKKFVRRLFDSQKDNDKDYFHIDLDLSSDEKDLLKAYEESVFKIDEDGIEFLKEINKHIEEIQAIKNKILDKISCKIQSGGFKLSHLQTELPQYNRNEGVGKRIRFLTLSEEERLNRIEKSAYNAYIERGDSEKEAIEYAQHDRENNADKSRIKIGES